MPGTAISQWLESAGRQPIVLGILRNAIQQKERVFAWHRGRTICFCPHLLARRGDEYYVLVYQILGEAELARAPRYTAKRWRWLNLWDLGAAHSLPGQWWSGPREGRPALEDATTELEVA